MAVGAAIDGGDDSFIFMNEIIVLLTRDNCVWANIDQSNVECLVCPSCGSIHGRENHVVVFSRCGRLGLHVSRSHQTSAA